MKRGYIKREYSWCISIDGENHKIFCRFAGDRYLIYADGVFVTKILLKNALSMCEWIQIPITLFGKECLFVMMDEMSVEFVIDGVMISTGRDYEKALRARARRSYVGYGILLGACMLLLVAVIWVIASGKGAQTGWYSIFIALGTAITMGAWSVKNLWRLTQTDNRTIIKQTPKEGDY